MKLKDITNKRFGRLVVIGLDHISNGKSYWKCLCDCGNEKTIRSDQLSSGRTVSCGCAQKEVATIHGMYGTRAYSSWAHMKERCLYKNHPAYDRYGGRGITINESWLTFEGFWGDMEEGYSDDLTLDRIDNDKGYCKENCRWSDMTQQIHHRRKYAGKSKFFGVSWVKSRQMWSASITMFGKRNYLGRFIDEIDAAIAYDNASEELYGDRPNNTPRKD